ncbi:DBH-like monooxygenase protein 1 [Hypsibius exemplaris]|uniref:DBH-like monooxygenase protein 1 n=1 Tax=Hypsibius exemplaris TaxID=2072580 RepID=A0A1W0WYR3_HYPEX|nr:DBH-like monooxygenase protein 1 [Hypsibius exemplaris]
MAFPLILGVVAFTVIQASGKSEAGPMSLPRETFLDEQKQAFLAWTFNDTHIDVSITVKTRGWLAFGLSPNGEMHQTDAFVAWVNDTDGVPFLQDGWLESNATARRVTLVRDSQQDWTLLQGIQTTDETMIRAVRALVTCDRHRDRPFSRDTLRILWAAHDKDPVDPARLPHHKKRGVKSMLMFSPSYLRTTPVPDTTTADTHPEEVVMQFEQVLIPNDTITLSQCRLFQLPKIEKKRHIIKTRAMVQSGNEQYVQRMLASLCRGKFEQNLSPATFDCHAPGNAQMMLAVRQNCDALIATWAVGGEVFSYPEETGLPLDVDSSGRYVLLEVQYGNLPKDVFLSEAIRDSSGIVLTTSDTLRRHDAAFLTTGLLQFD